MCPRYDPAFGKYNQPVDQNSGEQIMCEGLYTTFRGAVLTANSNTVQCTGLDSGSEKLLVVVAGTGFGQSRVIESIDALTGTATLTEPWRVVPVPGSRIMIGRYASRFAVYNNRLDGVERTTDPYGLIHGSGPAHTNDTATAGVSFYGAFLESVVDGNTITEVETGLANWSLSLDTAGSGTPVVQPNYFNLFTGNTVDHALQGMFDSFIETDGAPSQDVAIAGTIWRSNIASQITGYSIGSGSNHDNGWIEINLFENNHFVGGLYGFSSLARARSLVCTGNTFAGDGIGDGITYSTTHTPTLRENSWSNFATNYGGSLPGGQLQLPVRAMELSAVLTNAVVDVWNSGSSNLNWSASTTNSWISITTGSGAVSDESDSGLLTFHIDPVTIPAGISNGTITVIGHSQTNQLSVEFNN